MIKNEDAKILANIIQKTEKLDRDEKKYINALLGGWILKKEYDQEKVECVA